MTKTERVNQKTDYEKQVENVSTIPRFSLGQEVKTKYGIGIIVNIEMPSNGLYLQPERASCVVWYGTSKDTGFIQHSFRLSELAAIEAEPEESDVNFYLVNALRHLDSIQLSALALSIFERCTKDDRDIIINSYASQPQKHLTDEEIETK